MQINLFVIGASKCGTTFFHGALDKHPSICMSSIKEPCLFWGPSYQDNLHKVDLLFEHCGQAKYYGESSPIYAETIQFPEIPERIFNYNPEAKVIYIVREPFSRLRSVFRQTLSTGHWARKEVYSRYGRKMPLKYSDAVFDYPPLLEGTKYWTHISNFKYYMPDNSIKVIPFEKLASDAHGALQEAFDFLELDRNVSIDLGDADKNEGKGKSVYNPWLRRIRRLFPERLLRVLPDGAKRVARQSLQVLPIPNGGPLMLSQEDEAKVREILAPEVEAIYRYMGIDDDPWGFFATDQSD